MKSIFLSFVIAITFFACNPKTEPKKTPDLKNTNTKSTTAKIPDKKAKVTLEVIRAFDKRLPILSDKDFNEILNESKRIITMKLGDHVDINYHDNGVVDIKKFFANTDYQKTTFYTRIKSWKYDLNKGEQLELFKTEQFQRIVLNFLKGYKLKKLQGFFPKKEINSYEDFFKELMTAYHKKIKWLKSLKLDNGEALVIKPLELFQSYVEWFSYMYHQNKYDVVITNTLIVFDLTSEPYPHAVLKHAKVGGSSFTSPKRKYFNGQSLLVNILEEYGNVKGISNIDDKTDRTMKNKIIGGFIFAHEFGHAFYRIPDVYDHKLSCLMNSVMETIESKKGYQILIDDPTPCPQCEPWVKSKVNIINADLAFKEKKYKLASDLYLKAIELLPEKIDGNREKYIDELKAKSNKALKAKK